jgi:hypothetical protein
MQLQTYSTTYQPYHSPLLYWKTMTLPDLITNHSPNMTYIIWLVFHLCYTVSLEYLSPYLFIAILLILKAQFKYNYIPGSTGKCPYIGHRKILNILVWEASCSTFQLFSSRPGF